MASSRIPATIDALLSSWRTAPSLSADNVIDGPKVGSLPREVVFVGYDGDPEGDFTVAESEQEWAGLGAKRRDEEFDVVCSIVVTRGDSDVKGARDRGFAIQALLEDKLRSDPSLGMPGDTLPFTAEFRPVSVHLEPTAQGFQVRVVFNVHVKTRV
jgi:hypothetical protein